MKVDRCICHEITFAEIKRVATEKKLGRIKEIQENKIACTNCKLCVPYVELVLETGETVFDRSIRNRKR
jgi:bacterioferritin-associated ferredoxin